VHVHVFNLGNRCSNNLVQDVVFVIDTSGSIGSTRFQLIREFTANITTGFIRNSPGSAVGVILFARTAYIQFALQTYTSLNSLLSAINQLPYSGGGTNTHEALTLLRNDSSRVAIIITDGQSSRSSATLSAAAALHASNIFEIYAVGVGGANLDELEGIASNPNFVFYTSSFNRTGLQQLQNRIIPELCEGIYAWR